MDLNDLRKTPHLSASAVSDYISCGLLYKLGRVDKRKPDFTADALVFGTVIHRVLAAFYENLAQGNLLCARELQHIFAEQWEQAAKDNLSIRYKEGKSWESLLLEGKELIGAFASQSAPETSRVIGVEEAFSFEMKGLEVPVIGAFDLVLEDEAGVVTIVDHKTTARAYGESEIDKNLQMTLYQMAARANGHANAPILLRFDCLIKTKTPKFVQYYTTRTDQDEIRTAKKLMSVWDGIRKGVFVPNEEGWRCSGCSYKSSCENWFEQGGGCQ